MRVLLIGGTGVISSAVSARAVQNSHPECQKKDPEFDAGCDTVIAAYENCIANLPKYQ
jgi:hypothetical protein